MGDSQGITRLLSDWQSKPGDTEAAEALARRVYGELHDIARGRLARAPAAPLAPTELVNETWLRIQATGSQFRDRKHFFRLASICMRHLLVDLARERLAAKRGGPLQPVTLSTSAAHDTGLETDVLDLDRALEVLRLQHPGHAEVVELHCFGGLGFAELSELTGASLATVKRRWKFARAWLIDALRDPGHG
ncbi:MAG: ECF-type sigma factor [Gammaproteobacteria bacterium]